MLEIIAWSAGLAVALIVVGGCEIMRRKMCSGCGAVGMGDRCAKCMRAAGFGR